MARTFHILLSLLVAFSLTGTSCVRATEVTPQIIVSTGVTREDIFKIVNQTRASLNEPILIQNAKLQLAAQKKAEDMAKRGWFSHTSPEGTKVWPTIKAYDYQTLGENLAVNFDTSTSTVAAWIKSPTHYANIADADFRDTGIGIAVGSYGGRATSTFVVQLFGRQR